MSEIGSIKTVDEAGRIVIPADIRKRLQMSNGDMVHVYISDGKIILKEYEKTKLKKGFLYCCAVFIRFIKHP